MFKDKIAFLEALTHLPAPDTDYVKRAEQKQKTLTKPQGSLGRLESLACWLAGWQQTNQPCADHVRVCIFAGNHGLTIHNISPFPAEVTAQMVDNFKNGGAAINQICKNFDLALDVHPILLNQPTGDISCENAMTEAECLKAINIGATAIKPNDQIIVPGEMGIGNTTIASVICAKLYGGDGSYWAGAGTGHNKEGIAHKAQIIDQILGFHSQEFSNPFELLCHIGGREIAALCGLILAARHTSKPVILDGFIVGAAAAILKSANTHILEHCVAGHLSNEQAHRQLLENLGLYPPLLSLDMRLGEATGAALAIQIVRSAVSIHNGMASFEEAKITGNNNNK